MKSFSVICPLERPLAVIQKLSSSWRAERLPEVPTIQPFR
jgi:hypothetical protein